MIASSYRVNEENRTFKSEYIVSQSIMLACKRLGLDGVVYYSKRVEDEIFALPAVNVALFAEYKNRNQYSDLCNHIKIADSFSYSLFNQLQLRKKDIEYDLRCTNIGLPCKIGTYDRQYAYGNTQFAAFDRFLFSGWNSKLVSFGNALK